jgi:hypothetical protein
LLAPAGFPTPFFDTGTKIMVLRDYNGSGRWSRKSILAYYDQLARRLRVAVPLDLRPMESVSADIQRVYPVMDRIIEGIGRGDVACIEIGVEFIEEDQTFPFGKRLKSNAARALRRAELTSRQKERIRKRVMEMLIAGYTPHEYRQYAKLARKIGLGEWWAQAQGRVDLTRPYVRRYHDYFRRHVVGGASG